MTDLTCPRADCSSPRSCVHTIRETRLTQLHAVLNRRYGVELAKIMPNPRTGLDDETPCLVVSRGTTPSDVIVAVSVDPDSGVFLLAAFTSAAWFEYGDPFQCTERDVLERAAFWCLQFVPETPCT